MKKTSKKYLKNAEKEYKDIDWSEQSDEIDNKHKTLLQKREKSLRVAEKLSQAASIRNEDKILEEEPTKLHNFIPFHQLEPQICSQIDSRPPLDPRPTYMKEPIRVSPQNAKNFEELGLESNVVKVLRENGFRNAFAVQSAVFPLLQSGTGRDDGDVIISAATGSGKTLAYILPLIQDVARFNVSKLRGVIILPTRELVSQIKEVAEICSSAFSKDSKYRKTKIGISAGNETFKKEQLNLIEHTQKYDPKRYEEQLSRAESLWQEIHDNNGGIQNIFEEVDYPRLPGFVDEFKTKIDILICTPGRLVEHIKSSPGFSLKDLRWLVIDEADKIFSQSYQGCLPLVLSEMKSQKYEILSKRNFARKVIVSATITTDYNNLASLKLHRPSFILLEGESNVCNLSQSMDQAHVLPSWLREYSVKVEDDAMKPLYLMELLRRLKLIQNASDSMVDISSSRIKNPHLNPDSEHQNSDPKSSLELESESDSEPESKSSFSSSPHPNTSPRVSILPSDDMDENLHGVLIFTKSNETAARLARLITHLSPSSSSLIGVLTSNLPRISRQNYLNSFAKKKLSVLVASDLVSRGLDLPNLAHVINYDIPNSCVTYIHRVGRTARAGRLGYAWTLVTDAESYWFWKEIGSASNINRVNGKIQRCIFKCVAKDEQKRKAYLLALEKLEKEVNKFVK